MSASSLLPDELFYRLKAATRDLVKLAGGVVRAGAVVHHSKSDISRWQSTTEASLIDLPSVIALETECRAPVVTALLAEMHGLKLTDAAACAHTASVGALYAALMRQHGELGIRVADAMNDGVITPAEAEIIDRDAGELADDVRRFRARLAELKASGATDAYAVPAGRSAGHE